MNTTTHYDGSTVKARLGVFTPRQTEALVWITEGKCDKEAAVIMGCTPRTVKAHVSAVMGRLDCHTRAQMVGKLFMDGVVCARHIALLLLVTLTTGTLSGIGRPPLPSGNLQASPSAPTQPGNDPQPYRIRGGGSRQGGGRTVRITRTLRNSRRQP